MKHFLVILVILTGVYGDPYLNLDSTPLLNATKDLFEKTLKTMKAIPALKEKAYLNYTQNVKKSLGSYVNCPGVQTLKRDLESIGTNSVAYNYASHCLAMLERGTGMIDNTYDKDVLRQIYNLFGEIDNLTNHIIPKINKMKDVLPNYVVKYEPCTTEELKNATCGALLDFEDILQKYCIKIHEYTVNLTLAASFVGKFADDAWETVEKQLRDKVIDPVNSCTEEYDLDEYYTNVPH